MPMVLVWSLVLALVGLWSLGMWAVHALSLWLLAQGPALAGGAPVLQGLQLPAWLAPWLPAEALNDLAALAAGLVPLLQSLLTATPVLAGGVSVLAWLLWGLGTLLLLSLGGVGHGLLRWRARQGTAVGASAPAH